MFFQGKKFVLESTLMNRSGAWRRLAGPHSKEHAMSRGLGTLQRRILETLDEARAAMPWYRGSESSSTWTGTRFINTGRLWTRLGDTVVVLAPGVYDLRCSAAYLAETLGQVRNYGREVRVTRSFVASFARATHGLVVRGFLVRLRAVPVAQVIRPRHSQATSVFWGSWQLRFVTLSANPVGLTLRENQVPEDGIWR